MRRLLATPHVVVSMLGVASLLAGLCLLMTQDAGTESRRQEQLRIDGTAVQRDGLSQGMTKEPKAAEGAFRASQYPAARNRELWNAGPPEDPGIETMEKETNGTPVVEVSPTDELLGQLFDQLLSAGMTNMKLSERAESLIEQLASDGSDVASLLLKEYQQPEPPEVTRVVRNTMIITALGHLGTDEARDLLLGLALKEDTMAPALSRKAARAYVALVRDRESIRTLALSDSDGVRWVAARALVGTELDADTLEGLSRLLKSDYIGAHVAVAKAFGADPNKSTADRKVALLLDAAGRVDQLKYAKRQTYGSPWTESESAVRSYTDALSRVSDGGRSLQMHLSRAKGKQKTVILIALGMMKDTSVRSDLVEVIGATQDGALRTLAVEAFGNVATNDDVEFLQNLATSDPFRRRNLHDQGDSREIQSYPARLAAHRILKKMSDR